MHRESMEHMATNIAKYINPPGCVLDVGSMEAKKGRGTYRSLLTKFDYYGLDIAQGPNVDIIMEPYHIPFDNNYADHVVCGQVMEHCKNPFKLMKEIARVIKPGGYFLGVAPYKWDEHRYPVDCWRVMGDGWRSLFEESGLTCVETYYNTLDKGRGDSWGIAKK